MPFDLTTVHGTTHGNLNPEEELGIRMGGNRLMTDAMLKEQAREFNGTLGMQGNQMLAESGYRNRLLDQGQNQWQQGFNQDNQRYSDARDFQGKQFDYMKNRDTIGDSRWDKQFNEGEDFHKRELASMDQTNQFQGQQMKFMTEEQQREADKRAARKAWADKIASGQGGIAGLSPETAKQFATLTAASGGDADPALLAGLMQGDQQRSNALLDSAYERSTHPDAVSQQQSRQLYNQATAAGARDTRGGLRKLDPGTAFSTGDAGFQLEQLKRQLPNMISASGDWTYAPEESVSRIGTMLSNAVSAAVAQGADPAQAKQYLRQQAAALIPAGSSGAVGTWLSRMWEHPFTSGAGMHANSTADRVRALKNLLEME